MTKILKVYSETPYGVIEDEIEIEGNETKKELDEIAHEQRVKYSEDYKAFSRYMLWKHYLQAEQQAGG